MRCVRQKAGGRKWQPEDRSRNATGGRRQAEGDRRQDSYVRVEVLEVHTNEVWELTSEDSGGRREEECGRRMSGYDA